MSAHSIPLRFAPCLFTHSIPLCFAPCLDSASLCFTLASISISSHSVPYPIPTSFRSLSAPLFHSTSGGKSGAATFFPACGALRTNSNFCFCSGVPVCRKRRAGVKDGTLENSDAYNGIFAKSVIKDRLHAAWSPLDGACIRGALKGRLFPCLLTILTPGSSFILRGTPSAGLVSFVTCT